MPNRGINKGKDLIINQRPAGWIGASQPSQSKVRTIREIQKTRLRESAVFVLIDIYESLVAISATRLPSA